MNLRQVNKKSIIIGVVVVLGGVLAFVGINLARNLIIGASTSSEPKNIVEKIKEDGQSAQVNFLTEKPVLAVVEYGKSSSSLTLRSVETEASTSHNFNLKDLTPGDTYYYRVRVGEEIFDNGGIPYSFKVKEVAKDVGMTMPIGAIPTVGGGNNCSNIQVDYNRDGLVNALDYAECMKNGGVVTANQSIVQQVVPTTIVTTQTVDCMNSKIDYNSDGKINSMDIINCLKTKQ